MKTLLYVLLPSHTIPSQFDDALRALLAPYRLDQTIDVDQPNGKWDYLCRFESTLNCRDTDLELPDELLEQWAGYVSKVYRLRPDASAGAILTPDGVWHDHFDFGWKFAVGALHENTHAETAWNNYFRETLSKHADCWVIETWTHS